MARAGVVSGVSPWVRLGRSGATSLLIGLAACTAESAESAGPIVGDSAGITIIENQGRLAPDTLSWRADTANIVRIGAIEGDGPDVFGRIGGMARLSDGRIVVADREAHEIRFFAANGSFLTRAGRRGRGPGEYQYLSGMLKGPGDSLLVIDHEGNRLTVLSPEGGYVRSFRFQSTTGETPRSDPPDVRGIFSDGTFLIGEYLNACQQARAEGGICEDSMRYTRHAQSGDRVADFGAHAYYRNEMIRLPTGRNYGLSHPLAQVFWSLHGSSFFIADAARSEIRTHGPNGDLERIVRWAHEFVPVPEALRVPLDRGERAVTEQERIRSKEIAEAYGRRTWPSHLPAFDEFMVDREGNLWVREYATGRAEASARWLVFDSAGTLRYALRLPPIDLVPDFVFRWHGEIGNDYVLGHVRDSLGVESVWLVPLLKVRE